MGYRVEGFIFETEEEARSAIKEAEGIKYIRVRNNMNDPDTVLKLYNRLIEKEIFVTPVGFRFLEQLRGFLITIPYIRQEQMLPLPIYQQTPPKEDRKKEESTGQKRQEESTGQRRQEGGAGQKTGRHTHRHRHRRRDYYRPFIISTFLAVVFAVALIGIFLITAISSDNVTILNYEDSLIDRYEAWDEDLTRREHELDEREEENMGTEPMEDISTEITR